MGAEDCGGPPHRHILRAAVAAIHSASPRDAGAVAGSPWWWSARPTCRSLVLWASGMPRELVR
jgi:hypothetical protein